MGLRIEFVAGARFDRLVALEDVRGGAHRGRKWRMRCDCGTIKLVGPTSLIKGTQKSCGCYQRERSAARLTIHGLRKTPIYYSWDGIKRRCCDPNDKAYPNYGGRGIRVCERWLNSIEAFVEDMGPKPSPKHSVDRIDNDGDYCPENCRWATPKEQANNTTRNRRITFEGRTLTFAQWERELGLSRNTIPTLLKRRSVEQLCSEWALKKAAAGDER